MPDPADGVVVATLPSVVGDTSGSAIRVAGLSKRYGGVAAVDNLSFEVRAGAVTGFLGPNGAGKTTTLRMLTTLLEIDAGEVVRAGAADLQHR